MGFEVGFQNLWFLRISQRAVFQNFCISIFVKSYEQILKNSRDDGFKNLISIFCTAHSYLYCPKESVGTYPISYFRYRLDCREVRTRQSFSFCWKCRFDLWFMYYQKSFPRFKKIVTVTVIKNTPKGWSRVKENGGIYTAELIQSYENLPSVRLSEYTDKDYYFKVTEYECALTSQSFIGRNKFYSSDNAKGLWYFSGGRWIKVGDANA